MSENSFWDDTGLFFRYKLLLDVVVELLILSDLEADWLTPTNYWLIDSYDLSILLVAELASSVDYKFEDFDGTLVYADDLSQDLSVVAYETFFVVEGFV